MKLFPHIILDFLFSIIDNRERNQGPVLEIAAEKGPDPLKRKGVIPVQGNALKNVRDPEKGENLEKTGNGGPGPLEETGNEGPGPEKVVGGRDRERAQEIATEIQDLNTKIRALRTLKLAIFLTAKFKTLLDSDVLWLWKVFGGK